MKMYKESLRRLLPIGVLLAVATLLYTAVNGGQDCFGTVRLTTATTALSITPVLNYYVFAAAFFALYGFSFLFRRSASDLMLSMPVSRLDHYLSITLATATWMGGTIVLNTLMMLGMYWISGCPFVPGYVAMNLLFYFVASMLVFAAAAIGCALSGTALTAAASTLVVLFLPRFVQFVMARGVVANVPIVGWLDLDTWLDPSTNVATGLIVMWSRNQFIDRMVTMPHILYSMLPMAVELALGGLLFVRRPSERAERGATGKGWTIATATMLSFTILLMLALDGQRVFSFNARPTLYKLVVVAVALLVFGLYMLLATRDWKQSLKALPAYVLSVAVAFGACAGIRAMSDAALNDTPAPEEIASVSFRGHDETSGSTDYATLLISDLQFTGEPMRAYVADALSVAVENIRTESVGMVYQPKMVIEPIVLRLNNGRTIRRTIEFADSNSLNALRQRESDFFRAAIRAFPDERGIQFRFVDQRFTPAETKELTDSFISEASALGTISSEYYRPMQEAVSGDISATGGEQRFGGFSLAGYSGIRRYSDYYNLRMETPRTASLYMKFSNAYANADSPTRLLDAIKPFTDGEAAEDDGLTIGLSFFNLPWQNQKAQFYAGFYLYTNDDPEVYQRKLTYANRFAEIIARGVPTDDSSAFFAQLDWNYYKRFSDTRNVAEPEIYLSFSPADEQALIALINEWRAANNQ